MWRGFALCSNIWSDVALNCLCEFFVTRLTIVSDSLTITNVTEDDAGVYTCIMNTTLDHDSASAELNVVGKFAQFHWLVKANSQMIKVSISGFLRKVNPSNNLHNRFSFQPFKVNCLLRVYFGGPEQI